MVFSQENSIKCHDAFSNGINSRDATEYTNTSVRWSNDRMMVSMKISVASHRVCDYIAKLFYLRSAFILLFPNFTLSLNFPLDYYSPDGPVSTCCWIEKIAFFIGVCAWRQRISKNVCEYICLWMNLVVFVFAAFRISSLFSINHVIKMKLSTFFPIVFFSSLIYSK